MHCFSLAMAYTNSLGFIALNFLRLLDVYCLFIIERLAFAILMALMPLVCGNVLIVSCEGFSLQVPYKKPNGMLHLIGFNKPCNIYLIPPSNV